MNFQLCLFLKYSLPLPPSAVRDEKRRNDPEVLYPGGYYVNGVYVYPVTQSPPEQYVVWGADTPCNPYNNNTVPSATYPDCNTLTTRVALANFTTTTTVATTTAGSDVIGLHSLTSFCLSLLIFAQTVIPCIFGRRSAWI